MPLTTKLLAALVLSGLSLASQALQLGAPLPPLKVPTKGEFVLQGDRVSYAPWSSDSMIAGKPALVFHMPARMSSDAIISPLRKRLEQEGYAEDSFQSISVVNLAEAMWGTSGLVASEMANNKRAHPSAIMVADDRGRGPAAWQLSPTAVVVAIVDGRGVIRHLHEGRMSQANVDEIIEKLNAEIARAEKLAKK